MAQVVDLAYRADISQLQANLAKIPGLTEKEAKAMVKSLDRQMKRAESASKKAAAGTAKAWQKAGDPLKSFEKDAGKTEQVIQGLNGALNKVNPELSGFVSYGYEAAGAVRAVARSGAKVVAVLGPVAVAAAAAAAAYTYLSNEVEAAEERMKAASQAASAMQSTHKQAELIALQAAVAIGEKSKAEYDAALNADRATQIYADQTKAIDDQRKALTDELRVAKEREKNLEKTLETQKNMRETQGSILAGNKRQTQSTAKVSQETNRYTTQVALLEKQLKDNAAQEAALQSAIKKTEKDLNTISSASEKKGKSAKRSGKQSVSAAKAEAQAISKLWTVSEKHAAARLEGADAITAAAQKELEQIDAIVAAYPDSAEAAEAAAAARAEVHATLAADIEAHNQERIADAKAAVAAIRETEAKAAAEAEAEMLERAETERAAWEERTAAAAEFRAAELEGWGVFYESMTQGAEDAFGMIADAHEDAANEVLETAQAATAAAEEALSEAEDSGDAAAIAHAQNELAKVQASEEAAQAIATTKMEAAVRAFRAEQAASVASVLMSTAQAVIAALVPPPIGYGPIAGPAAAAGLTALGAVQVAGIMAQEPPSFHTGGMIRNDETAAVLRKGEGVLTAQGVRQVGGPGGVADANAGRGSSSPVVVQHVYKHRNLDTVVVDHLKTNSALRKATSSSRARGRRNPYNGSL